MVASFVCALLLGAPLAREPLAPAPGDPWEMHRNLVERRRLEVQVASEDAELLAVLEAAAERLEARDGYHTSFGADPDAARLVFGTVGDEGVVALLEPLGVEVMDSGNGFRFARDGWRQGEDLLVATYEDPERLGLPLTVYLANSVESLAHYAFELAPCARPGFRVYRAGEPVLEGALTTRGEEREGTRVDRRELLEASLDSSLSTQIRGIEFINAGGLSDEVLTDYAQRAVRARNRVKEWAVSAGAARARLRVEVHAHAEDMARRLGRVALFDVPPTARSVHVLLSPGIPDDAGAGLSQALAVASLGPPAEVWLWDAAAVYGTDTYWGQPVERWLARLARAEMLPGMGPLLNGDSRRSPHLLVPLRGELLRLLVEERGAEAVRRLWRGEEELSDEAGLYERLSARIAGYLAAEGANLERETERARARTAALPWRPGICLEPHGVRPEEGYASRLAAESLAEAHALGARAVALSVRAFVQRAALEHGGIARWRAWSADRSDAELAQGVASARALGFSLHLAPHLLSSPQGDHAGLVHMADPDDWVIFFEDFERFVTHYALLAQLLRVESYAVAGELNHATRFTPDERRIRKDYELLDFKRRRWHTILDRARAAYGGGLAYAASFGKGSDEARRFDLWERFDYLSVVLFDALRIGAKVKASPQEDAMVERYGEALDDLFSLGESKGLPVLICETGFASCAEAWQEPRGVRGELDLEEQRKLYATLNAALASRRSALAGLFIWKWSTDPDAGGLRDRGFSPQGKPALEEIRRLFGNP